MDGIRKKLTSLICLMERSTDRNHNSTSRQSSVQSGKNGSVSPTPVIIEVQGVKETNDSTKYNAFTKMGNWLSAENDQMMAEQTEPLNKGKSDAEPKEDDVDSAKDNDRIENNNENLLENTEHNNSRTRDSKLIDKNDNNDTDHKNIVESETVKTAMEQGGIPKADRSDSDCEEEKNRGQDKIIAATDVSDKIDFDEHTGNKDETIDSGGGNQNKETKDDSYKITSEQSENKAKGKEADGNKGANGNRRIDSQSDDDVIVTVAGKDDVDAASTYSLFMERDFRYYFQHPYCRLFFCYFVVFCNFLIYAEDPVAHSRKECLIPMVGNDFAFVGTRYPPNAWSLLKVVFWLIGIAIGLVIGKLLVHGFLFNRLFRLKMFSDDQGSWMIMFLITLITVFIMSLIYNGFLSIGGDATSQYRISDLMGVSNDIFMKVAACGTWCGDFFTAWMVTDIMLQEKLYPGWARPVRRWWKRGWNRIILFWIVVFVSSFVVIFVIATDYIQWDKLNRDFLPTNELSRAFLASFILVMDLMIVMQDWDFPHFISAIDIKLPGLNTAHIRFSIPKCLKRESWNVHITGKWFNYGILFLVMILDMNMWKNQIFYSPYDYGQYTGPEDKIYTVQDQYSLDTFNETLTTFEYRNSTINPNTNLTYVSTDTHMNSRYYNFHLGVKGIAFIPSLCMFITFGVLVWMFGRFKPTDKDPYAGRLKKRIKKKKRFSFRISWKRRQQIRRKIQAVPKLLYFRRKGSSKHKVEIEEKETPSEGFSVDNKEVENGGGENIEVQAKDKAQDKNNTSGEKSWIRLPKPPIIHIPEVLAFWRKKNEKDTDENREQSEIPHSDQTIDKHEEKERKNDMVVNVEVAEARKEENIENIKNVVDKKIDDEKQDS